MSNVSSKNQTLDINSCNNDLTKSWIVVSDSSSQDPLLNRATLNLTKSFQLGDSWVNIPNPRNNMLEWSTASVVMIPRENITLESDLSESLQLGNSWVMMPYSLERSWVDVRHNDTQDEIIVGREVKDLTHKNNSTVLTKLLMVANLTEGIIKGGQFTVNNWDKVVCGVAGIMGGTVEMISLNPMHIGMGALRVFASIKVMWEAYDKMSPNQVQAIVSDSKASVEAIRILAKSNEASLDRLQEHLAKAKDRTDAIQQQLDKIATIKTNGHQAVEDLQFEAQLACSLAKGYVDQAQSKFEDANKIAEAAQIGFNKVIESLNTMISLFQIKEGTDEQRIETLAKLAKEIADMAEVSYEQMEQAQQLRSEGDVDFKEVIQFHLEAAETYGQAIATAEIIMQKMARNAEKAKAQNDLVIKDVLEVESVIVNEIKPRNEDMAEIAKDVVEDLNHLQNNVSDRASLLKMGTCAFLAIALNPIMSPIAAVVLSLATVYYANALVNTVIRCIAKKANKENTFLRINHRIALEFDPQSTSLGRRIRGMISQTTGNLDLTIGKQNLKMRFDLNAKHKLSKADLVQLANTVRQEVANNTMTKGEALELIANLKGCPIERKSNNLILRNTTTVQYGLIAYNQPLLNELERELGKEDILAIEGQKTQVEDSFDIYRAAVIWC